LSYTSIIHTARVSSVTPKRSSFFHRSSPYTCFILISWPLPMRNTGNLPTGWGSLDTISAQAAMCSKRFVPRPTLSIERRRKNNTVKVTVNIQHCQQSTVNSQQSTGNSQHSSHHPHSEKSIDISKQSTVKANSKEKYSVKSQQSTVNSQQSAVNSQQSKA